MAKKEQRDPVVSDSSIVDALVTDIEEMTMSRGGYIRRRMRNEHSAKRQIARRVASTYIDDFHAVLLDAGSTAELIAEEMFAQIQYLSVLTNNMGAYAAYTRANVQESFGQEDEPLPTSTSRNNELLITGGRYVDIYESLLGEGAIASIQEFTPNVTIVGTSGLRWEEGIFCHGAEESAVKELLWAKKTDIRIIATDWTKIGKRDAHAFGEVKDLTLGAKRAVIVTCRPPRSIYDDDTARAEEFDDQITKMEEHGIEVDAIETKSIMEANLAGSKEEGNGASPTGSQTLNESEG